MANQFGERTRNELMDALDEAHTGAKRLKAVATVYAETELAARLRASVMLILDQLEVVRQIISEQDN